MNDAEADSIAATLAGARIDRARLSAFPGCVPPTLDEAYRIQDRVLDRLGGNVAGWKIAALPPEAAARLGTRRICGPILLGKVMASGSYAAYPLDADRKTEAELAFHLAKPLPPRRGPYEVAEVADAIRDAHAAMEIAGSSIRNVANFGVAAIICDLGFNDGFVHGDALTDWRQMSLSKIAATLTVDGETARGSSGDVPGGPLQALLWLVNHLSARGMGLREGDWVTTGCCGRMIEAGPTAVATANFGQGAVAELTFEIESD